MATTIKTSILGQNYVKFVRTTPAMWNKLVVKDSDTLYFLIENGSENGSLYLGDILIASNVATGTCLADLTDVHLGTLVGNSVLVYDGSGWVNKTLSEITPGAMVGASETTDGEGGLVPQPTKDDVNKFLAGDGTWKDPTAALVTTVGDLTTTVENLDGKIDTLLGDAEEGSSVQDIVAAAIAQLIGDSEEDPISDKFDTLKEIADWILDNKAVEDYINLESSVGTLDQTINGTEAKDYADGLVSRVSVLEAASQGFNTDIGNLQTSVGNLETVIGDANGGLVKDIADNASAISALQDALKWQTLVEEEENV